MQWNTYIGHFFLQIINESLTNGIFSEKWKTSTITPITKNNNTKKANEHRPINSIPNEEKILEYIVKEQLQEYIESNKILTECQSAYREKHSCETALNLMISECRENKEKGQITIMIFLDLQRAFETVDRERMIEKMINYGISGAELNWFWSYMQNRKQVVKYKNEKSDEKSIPIGLAQGTKLSVYLFLLYINDIVEIPKYGEVRLFADDTVVIIKSDSLEDAIEKANEALDDIYKWLNTNKLKLNINKTKCMIIDKSKNENRHYELRIGNQNVEQVENIKYLGVEIDDKMTMNAQIEKMKKKMASKVNFLSRIKNKLTLQTKK